MCKEQSEGGFDPETWARLKEQLPIGKEGEAVVGEDLKNLGYTVNQTEGYHNYDLSATTKGRLIRVEIKTDLLGHKTGNVGLEYEQNSKPSGIETTESDVWAWYIKGLNQILYFDTDTVRSFITDELYTTTKKTVNSCYYLIPIRNIIGQAKLIRTV
jgi:hypothetical protein